jgi:hypothetical protein
LKGNKSICKRKRFKSTEITTPMQLPQVETYIETLHELISGDDLVFLDTNILMPSVCMNHGNIWVVLERMHKYINKKNYETLCESIHLVGEAFCKTILPSPQIHILTKIRQEFNRISSGTKRRTICSPPLKIRRKYMREINQKLYHKRTTPVAEDVITYHDISDIMEEQDLEIGYVDRQLLITAQRFSLDHPTTLVTNDVALGLTTAYLAEEGRSALQAKRIRLNDRNEYELKTYYTNTYEHT